MKTLNTFSRLLLLSYCTLATVSVKASGGDDHTHAGEKSTAETNGKKYFSSEAISDKYELFLKYQPHEPGEEATLWLFISDYRTNEPLDSASFKITSKEDKNLVFEILRVDRGYYEVKTTFPSARKYSLMVSISGDLGSDLLLLQDIEPGKKLAEVEEEHSHSFFSSSLFLVGIGLAAGLLLMFVCSRWSDSWTIKILLPCDPCNPYK